MRTRFLLLVLLGSGVLGAGCSHLGESTAPKPDPAQFMPKGGTAGGPPPSSPSSR